MRPLTLFGLADAGPGLPEPKRLFHEKFLQRKKYEDIILEEDFI
jgi:hypothetical protein